MKRRLLNNLTALFSTPSPEQAKFYLNLGRVLLFSLALLIELSLYRLQDQFESYSVFNAHSMAGFAMTAFITSFFIKWIRENIYLIFIFLQLIFIAALSKQIYLNNFDPLFSYFYLFVAVFASLFLFKILHLAVLQAAFLIIILILAVMTDSHEIPIDSFLLRYIIINFLVSVLIAFRIRSGEKLRDRGNQFTNLFLQLGDAALYINKEMTVELINNQLGQLSGFSKDSLSGKSANELLPGVIGLLSGSSHSIEDKIESEALQLVKNNGDQVPIRLIATPLFDDDLSPNGFVCLITDISIRKAEEDKLRAYSSQLSTAKRELEQFSRFASHDLKAPLGTIAKYTQLLKKDYSEGQTFDEKSTKWLDVIIDDANRMDLLIDALLSYTGSGEEFMDQAPLDMNQILEAAKSNLATTIEENEAEIIIPENLPDIYADKNQMVRMMQNLIGNAINYRREETPKIKITSNLNDSASAYIFAVEDNGMGIDGKYFDKVFNLFQRLHSREYPGFGVGLAICKKIVDNHHGKIWLKSIKGRGSTIYFSIPTTGKE